MRIRDVKDHLHDPHVLEVLSHCLYKPAEVKSYADRYASDPDIRVFSCVDNGRVLGVMVLKRQAVSLFEIVGIAVDPASKGRGIGSELIAFAVHHLPWDEIRAEDRRWRRWFLPSLRVSCRGIRRKTPRCCPVFMYLTIGLIIAFFLLARRQGRPFPFA